MRGQRRAYYKPSRKASAKAALFAVLVASALITLGLPSAALAAGTDSKETDVSVTLTAGALALNEAPTMDFGSHPLSVSTENYTAAQDAAIKISDIRGTAAGWKLTVALGNFRAGGLGSQTLAGSFITIPSAAISASNGTTGSGPSMAGGSVRLDSDGTAATLLVANASQGAGVWSADLGATPTLTVYPGATVGNHTAKLNWVLEDTP